MATSPQTLPQPSAASCRYTPAPERLRLRNSCHGCASSKLKCSQEKPTCSRCAKRSLNCEYLAAKPGGRKPNRQSVSSQTRPTQPGDAYAFLQIQAEPAVPPSSNLDRPSSARIPTSSSMVQDLFGSMEEGPSSASATTHIEFGDYFSTPISDRTDMDILGAADLFSSGVSSSNTGSDEPFDTFPLFGDTISELFTVSIPSPIPETSMQLGIDLAQSYQGFGANKSPHSCLNRALRSMEQISSVSCHKEAASIMTVRTIVTENKAAIEAISTTLTCTCSQDGYLLVIISFVIFKVLDLYATAARHAPSLQDSQGPGSRASSVSGYVLPTTTIVGNYCLEGADSGRMAAQLVLNELHLVRRVVERLSSALKKQAVTMEGRVDTDTRETLGLDMVSERVLPFSPATYDNLALDLVKRCKALSLGIMNQLREL